MRLKRWTVAGAAVLVAAVISVWAGSPKFRAFKSSVYLVTVSQTSEGGSPKYLYQEGLGHDLVALALGADPTSSQVLALAVNCDSTVANLIVYDKSNANITTIAQSTAIDKVQQVDSASAKKGSSSAMYQQRFVAVFEVQPVGNLTGGYLTIAGRLNLDTNGCPQAVENDDKSDKKWDKQLGDQDIVKYDPDVDKSLKERSGQAHLIGVLDVISGGQTNTLLIPSGHLTFCQQLDEFVN